MRPTQERLLEIFIYDPTDEQGLLINRITRNSRAQAGERAGFYDNGYRCVYVDSVKYGEHKIIWLYMTGEWAELVDHKDGNTARNVWSNLRETDYFGNAQNAVEKRNGSSTPKGVYLRSDRHKWRATITARGQFHHLGDFNTADEAHEAYRQAAERLHGEFAEHNRPNTF